MDKFIKMVFVEVKKPIGFFYDLRGSRNGCLVAAYGTEETLNIPDNVKTIGTKVFLKTAVLHLCQMILMLGMHVKL